MYIFIVFSNTSACLALNVLSKFYFTFSFQRDRRKELNSRFFLFPGLVSDWQLTKLFLLLVFLPRAADLLRPFYRHPHFLCRYWKRLIWLICLYFRFFFVEKILLVYRNFFYDRFLCQKFNNDIAAATISHWSVSQLLILVSKVTEDTTILTATMGSSINRPKNFFCCSLFPAKIRGVCCEGRHS